MHWQQVPGGLAGLNWEGSIPSPDSDLGGGGEEETKGISVLTFLLLSSWSLGSLDVFPEATVPPSFSLR